MLSHLCDAMQAGVIKSNIEQERAGMRCFAKVQFGKRIVIGYYIGTLSVRICMVVRTCKGVMQKEQYL